MFNVGHCFPLQKSSWDSGGLPRRDTALSTRTAVTVTVFMFSLPAWPVWGLGSCLYFFLHLQQLAHGTFEKSPAAYLRGASRGSLLPGTLSCHLWPRDESLTLSRFGNSGSPLGSPPGSSWAPGSCSMVWMGSRGPRAGPVAGPPSLSPVPQELIFHCLGSIVLKTIASCISCVRFGAVAGRER